MDRLVSVGGAAGERRVELTCWSVRPEAPGRVYNLLADAFIDGHSEIKNHHVAHAMLAAVSATASPRAGGG